MTEKEITVSSFDNLNLDIYVVGYPTQGESILCVLREDDRILFVSLVDTFTPSNCVNYVTTILDTLGKPNIDLLVWTHPDEDHTVGIAKIMEDYDPHHQADIIVPAHITEIAGKEAMSEYYKLKALYNPSGRGITHRTNMNEVSLTLNEERPLYRVTLVEIGTNSKIQLRASFYLPNSSMVIRKAENWASAKTNEYSIVHSLVFNEQKYLFCGDLTKNNVAYLPESFYSGVKFIKIPHHGSNEPSNLAGKLFSNGVKDSVSATTVYRIGSSDDPEDDLLHLYESFCSQVFSTGKDSKQVFGCIKLTMNRNGHLISFDLQGNAECLWEKNREDLQSIAAIN